MERAQKMSIEILLSKRGKHAGKYVAVVDDCDADLANFDWSISFGRSLVPYAHRGSSKRFSRQDTLHRVIAERMFGKDKITNAEIDHRDRNPLNCQRENIRLATRQQNIANRGKYRTNKSSHYKGVFWDKAIGKWRAAISVNHQKNHLGVFASEESAARSYDIAAKKLHGDFAHSNLK